jgi:3-oxoacyl-[acyl-carrier protein] reductase
MLLDLSDRVVVVTGAASGIGRTIAETFVRERCRVVACDLALDALEWFEPLAAQHGAEGIARACDVRDTSAVNALITEAAEHFGRIDVLVNNAGIAGDGLVSEIDDATWERCFDVNVTGTLRTCRAVIPIMKAQGSGRIVNAASFAAIVPAIGTAAYAASKSAVVQLTRTLAGELGPWNITANAYAPGMIPSGINTFAEQSTADQDRLLDTLTLRRWGEAQEVADVICFLASDAARYITGALIDVSGGKLATQLPQRAYELAGLRR